MFSRVARIRMAEPNSTVDRGKVAQVTFSISQSTVGSKNTENKLPCLQGHSQPVIVAEG